MSKLFLILVIIVTLTSCTMTLPPPEVFTRGSFQATPNTHFYILGSPRFGLLTYMEDNLISKRLSTEIVMDKRDIPEPSATSRMRYYIVSHEIDQVSEGERRGRGPRGNIDRLNITAEELEREFMNETWRLVIRVSEFNPRGTDRQVAIATTTASLLRPNEMLDFVMNSLFTEAGQ